MISLATRARSSGLAFAVGVAILAGCGDSLPAEEAAGWRAQPLDWTKPQRPLESSVGRPYDLFGDAVALSAGIALLGSPGASPGEPQRVSKAGTATLFLLEQGQWAQHRILQAPSLLPNAQFGFSVAATSGAVVVGAPLSDPNGGLDPVITTQAGLVYALQHNADWNAPIETIVDPARAAFRRFGHSVAVGPDTLVVGAPGYSGESKDPGQAVAFRRTANSWVFEQYLDPPVSVADGDRFGAAVSLDIDASTVLIGAYGDTERGVAAGAAYIFARANGTWVRRQKLIGGDTAPGDEFGAAVALNGSKAIVGSIGNLEYLGAAYVFVRDPTTGFWREEQKLVASAASRSDTFGQAVALAGGVAWVGAPTSAGTGALHPFVFDSSAWLSRETAMFTQESTHALLGYAVSASGGSVLIGAPYANETRGQGYVLGLANGSTCKVDSDCSTGHCVDQVCCNTACDNRCNSCREDQKGSGADGVCGPVESLSNPRLAPCTAQAVETCGTTGLCDGQGKCAVYAKGVECGPPGCVGDAAEDPADSCDGHGTCVSTPVQSCGAFVCGNDACLRNCVAHSDCGVGKHCDVEGSCQLNRGLAAKCSFSEQCASGFCADGVCCDAACEGQCQACAEPKSVGTCLAVVGAPRGERPACAAGEDQPCAAAICDGRESDHCAGFVGSETVCQKADCKAGKAVSEGRCNARGACAAAAEIECGAYACGEAACLTECRDGADCAGGTYCDGQRCVSGALCSADSSMAFNEVGVAEDCFPFKCDEGKCLRTCSGVNQCAEGNLFCSPDTGKCELVTADVMASERRPSTSCSFNGARSRDSAWEYLMLLAFAVSARRRQLSALRANEHQFGSP